MDKPIFIFGHKNPDTDSICAAITYANLKQQIGYKKAKAVRIGDLNAETCFVLDYFNQSEPPLLKDIKPQGKDLDYTRCPKIFENTPLKTVWDFMRRYGKAMFPVVKGDDTLSGIISLSDITYAYMELSDETILRQYQTRFSNLVEVLDGEIVVGVYGADWIQGNIYTDSTLNEDMPLSKGDIVITGHNKKLHKLALESGAGCIIVTGLDSTEKLEKDAEKQNVVLVKTPHTFFKTIKLMNQSIPVSSIMKTKDLIYFEEEDYIEEIKEIVQDSKYRNFPILDKEGRVLGIISRRQLIDFNRKQVILVDHNEKGQSISGIEQAHILEVIDHHRVADIRTMSPLYFRAEPVGCTCTIIAKMYKENNIIPSKKMAGLMLSAILSDTLLFHSPTCTEEDKKIAYELGRIAELDVMKYGLDLITAGSSLEGREPEEIIRCDLKEFIFGSYRVAVSQINTTDFQAVYDMKQSLQAVMEMMSQEKEYDLMILMITDITLDGTELLVVGGAKELLQRAFGMSYEEDTLFLPGVLSRKKQVIPKLMGAVD
ncbi:MAG: putative manganese-dependent inorganic diphosphatase [Epulopiscium sp.]|nr:putative manganese-dependent inorganic diphosphatase [Candidatus Epulonipiscium sp.]